MWRHMSFLLRLVLMPAGLERIGKNGLNEGNFSFLGQLFLRNRWASPFLPCGIISLVQLAHFFRAERSALWNNRAATPDHSGPLPEITLIHSTKIKEIKPF